MIKLARSCAKYLLYRANDLVVLTRFPFEALFIKLRPTKEKLHVGSGENRFPGWYNADIKWNSEVIVFMGRSLPFPSNSLKFVHSEHVIEHVPRENALSFVSEVRRVLAPGGVCRIGTPDLDELVDAYVKDDWRKFSWVKHPGHRWVDSRTKMINASFHWWGHQFLYDRNELIELCREAGFENINVVERLKSQHPELAGLETRDNTNLIVEIVK